MKKISLILCCTLILTAILALSGCSGGKETTGGGAPSGASVNQGSSVDNAKTPSVNEAGLKDGLYLVDVETDSSMFHLNEAKDGKGELTVKDGHMTLHITLTSKKIVHLFLGTAEEAEAAEESGQPLIDPTEDEVTYDDGITDTAYGFDIPVESLGGPITVAIIGTHGNWYTHEVSISNPVPAE